MAMTRSPVQPPISVTLTELDHRPMTTREWLTLLPAIIISLILNGLFVALLIFFNAGNVRAEAKLKSIQEDDSTQLAEKNEEELSTTIDLNTPDITAPKDITQPEKLSMPALDPVVEKPLGLKPPEEKEPIGGAGGTEEGKFRGADAIGADALKGDPILAELGGVGTSGSMPIGGGAGIFTGAGGGSSKGGGFGYRSGDLSSLAKRLGGSDESERAVALGLHWLRMHQSNDGRWSIDKYHTYDSKCDCRVACEREVLKDQKGKPVIDENGNTRPAIRSDDVSGTALGLLPFLGAGHHHLSQKPEGKIVNSALRFIVNRQRQDGSFGETGTFDMYTQALATIALCEAYGMSGDARLRDAAQKAVFFICKAQHSVKGGWRYQPNTDGDSSVTGWQVMALKSAQIAGLTVPAQTLEGASKWYDYAEYKRMVNGRPRIRYAYEVMNDLNAVGRFVPKSPGSPGVTAVGLLNRLYLGWGPRNANLIAGCDELMDYLPPVDNKQIPKEYDGIYYWYHASQVMHHMGGEYWNTWNPRMRDYLIKSQEKQGHKAGSWDPTGHVHAPMGGRLYVTSLSLLTLEVYYRHLPLYRREKLADEPDRTAVKGVGMEKPADGKDKK